MTHADLIKKASKWLESTIACSLILTELRTYVGEIPDVLAWRATETILLEIKTSYSDFRADRKKPHRYENLGMGSWRFYFTLPGVIPVNEIPKGWGLYELKGERVFFAGGVKYERSKKGPCDSNKKSEIITLLSVIARIAEVTPDDMTARFYKILTAENTTIGINANKT